MPPSDGLVCAALDQVALQINREREAGQPRRPLLLLPDLLRNALASSPWLLALPPCPGNLAQKDPAGPASSTSASTAATSPSLR
jgi:hypothetical protein